MRTDQPQSPSPGSSCGWEYKTGSGKWKKMEPDVSRKLTQAHRGGETVVITSTHKFTIEVCGPSEGFVRGKQVNLLSKKERDIRGRVGGEVSCSTTPSTPVSRPSSSLSLSPVSLSSPISAPPTSPPLIGSTAADEIDWSKVEQLDTEHLQPQKDENKLARSVIHEINSCLQTSELKVAKVETGGSFEHKTHLRGDFDLDLVCFLNDFNHGKLQAYFNQAKKALTNEFGDKVKFEGAGNALPFTFKTGDGAEIDIDLLLTDALIQPTEQPKPGDDKWTFCAHTKEQTAFVTKQKQETDGKFVMLVRVLKHWRNKTGLRKRKQKLSSFTICVLLAHVLEKGGQVYLKSGDYERVFERFFALLSDVLKLEVKQHDQETTKPAPFVLDPANQYNNLIDKMDLSAIGNKAQAERKKIKKSIVARGSGSPSTAELEAAKMRIRELEEENAALKKRLRDAGLM